jgi:hypothetical protein
MAKHKKTVTNHDMRRAIEDMYSMMLNLQQRILNIEYVLSSYVEMKRDEKKFTKFLDKKKDVEDGKQ